MIRITAFAGALLCLFVNFAEARPHRQAPGLHPDCNITMPCIVVKPFKAEVRGPLQPQMFTRKKHKAETVSIFRNLTVQPQRIARAVVGGVGGLVAPLAAKASEIMSACGSRSLGGVSHRRIAGTRIMSLHSYGKAIDLQGNPSCIYAHLHGWPGGYSTDYATAPNAKHVHISYDADGRREWGLRFAHRHYGGRHRYAKRHHGKRYARKSRHPHYATAVHP